MIDRDRLVKTFCDLARIDSPSGEEETIAVELVARLEALGLGVQRDSYGNVIASDGRENPIMLSAHMDTVEPGRGIKPRVEGDRIVADGTTVAIEDRDLETVDRVPLASTPLGLILDDELDFENEARVTDVQRTAGEIAITIEDRSGEAEGQLTLYFDPANYQLTSWRALDANRQVTRVALQDIKTNVSVDPRLFRMEDPADEEEDER